MKKLLTQTLTVVAALVFVAGCTNPLINPGIDDANEGTFELRLAVPNYDYHEESAIQPKIISPASRVIEVVLDGIVVWEDELWDYNITDEASNGFFYTFFEAPIIVPIGTYSTLDINLLTGYRWDIGTDITTGSAAGPITITPGGSTTVSVTLTPPAGMFTPLTVGGAAATETVLYKDMEFYSFSGSFGTEYAITITPTIGQPDVYLFDSDGRKTGTEMGRDVVHTETNAGGATTMTTYRLEASGTYYIGVYGWDGDSDYDIEVFTPGPVSPGWRVPSTPDPKTDIEIHVSNAFDALQNQDFDAALGDFSLAYALDPEYGPAFAGYNALYLMNIVTDPDIVYMAREVLGLEDYPTSMSEAFTGVWIQELVNPDGYNDFLPRIKNMANWDGADPLVPADGYIDGYERLMAFLSYFVTHSSGFDSVLDVVLPKLGDRLDYIIGLIDSMPSDLSMEFTWDMAFDDWETEGIDLSFYGNGFEAYYSWPTDGHGNPIDIKIGKADLLGLAALLEVVESFIYLSKVYYFNLLDGGGTNVLAQYWADFNPVDGTAPGSYTSTTSPFATDFLLPKPTWPIDMEASRNSMLSGLFHFISAAYEVKADPPERAGFTLSSTSSVPDIAANWGETDGIIAFQIKVAEELHASISDPAYTYIQAIDFNNFASSFDYFTYYAYGNWPDTVEPGVTVGVNFGVLFQNPMAFAFELGVDGEPIWYNYNPAGPQFDVVLAAGDIDETVHDWTFARVPDITLGGLIPIENTDMIPRDDSLTRARISYFSYDDADGDSYWDVGETIWQIDIQPNIEGAIDMYNFNLASEYPGGDFIAYYQDNLTSAAVIPDGDLAEWVDPAVDLNDFRTAIDAATPYFGRPGMMVVLNGSEVYLSTPTEAAWHSLAPAGTVSVDPDAQPVDSTGSIWWYLLNQATGN